MRPKKLSRQAIEAAAKRAETFPKEWEGGSWYNEREIGLEKTLIPLAPAQLQGVNQTDDLTEKEKPNKGGIRYLAGFFSGANIPATAEGGCVAVCAAFVDQVTAASAHRQLVAIYKQKFPFDGAYPGDFEDELDEGRGEKVAAVFRQSL